MGIITSTDLLPEEEFLEGKDKHTKIFPFNNKLIEDYCMQYQLSARDISNLYALFCDMDSSNQGYINLRDILRILQETRNSIVYPYLEGLFKLTPRKEKERADFFEWVTLVMEYSIMDDE